MLIKNYEAQALKTLHGSLAALEGEMSKETIRDAMEAALRLTEAIGDLSEVLISMLDHIDGDTDLEDSHDREEDFEREDEKMNSFIPIYEVDQSRPPVGFRDTRITN